MDEESRTTEWQKKLKSPPFNVDAKIYIPFVFVDPVVDVFDDPANPYTTIPSEREENMFNEYTKNLETYMNDAPRFDCSAMCQAPPAIFSGMPVLNEPSSGSATFKMDGTESFVEWHSIKTTGVSDPAITINDEQLDLAMGEGLLGDGLNYRLEQNNIAQKVMSFKLYLWSTKLTGYEHLISMKNDQGTSKMASIKWTVEPVVTLWTEWSPCSVQCMGQDARTGSQTRTRSCTEGVNAISSCQFKLGETVQNNVETQSKICPVDPETGSPIWCSIDAIWSDWEPWGRCSANCGIGKKVRRKSCTDGKFGGSQCTTRFEEQEEECPTGKECPKNCKIGAWGSWTGCSDNCISETDIFSPKETRQRNILSVQTGEGSIPCELYRLEEERLCPAKRCPKDGQWSRWLSWSPCSSTCEGGVKTRERFCIPPSFGGAPCRGDSVQTEKCNTGITCRCEFSDWSPWNACDVSCGQGKQSRSRTRARTDFTCNESNGPIKETQTCFPGQCPEESSCLLGESKILMSDMSTKAVQDLRSGDLIMDGNLENVEVLYVGKNYLGDRTLYQFGTDGPIFTPEHVFVSNLEKNVRGVVSKGDFFREKPQFEHLDNINVFNFDQLDTLLQVVNGSNLVSESFNLRIYDDEDLAPNTPVYFVITSSPEGSYVVNDFVSKDGLPNFDAWPMTFATLGLILDSPDVPKINIETYEEDLKFKAKVLELMEEWEKALKDFDHESASTVQTFDVRELWKDQGELMQRITEKFKLAELLNLYGARMLHRVLDDEKVALENRFALMLQIVAITNDFFLRQ